MGEWRRGGVGKWGVAKGGGKKNGRAKKTGVARDLCHPHNYASVLNHSFQIFLVHESIIILK